MFNLIPYELKTNRLVIRTINPNEDLQAYLAFMNNKENKFIKSSNLNWTQGSLSEYIQIKNESADAILLGLFDLKSKLHIGNIKYEPINFNEKYCIMGILIGNSHFRGKGFAKEAILHTFEDLLIPMKINKIILGVDKLNQAAILAYKKCGFITTKNPILKLPNSAQEMTLTSSI